MLNPKQIAGTGSRRNLIGNANFNVWQRGTSWLSAALPTSGYTADRWVLNRSTTGTTTISRSTNVPTGIGAQYSLQATVTGTDTSIAAGDIQLIKTQIEGYDILPLIGKPVTLSFWIATNKAGTYSVWFGNESANRNYLAEYTVTASEAALTQWVKRTITFTPDWNGVWSTTHTSGMQVAFMLMAGTTYTAAPGYNAQASKIASTNQVNWLNDSGNTWNIAQVQLEAGSIATPFEFVDRQTDLQRCQRYCWVWNSAGGAFTTLMNGHTRSTTITHGYLVVPVPLRIWPTLAVSSHTTDFRIDNGGGVSTVSNLALNSGMTTDVTLLSLTVTHAAATAQQPTQVLANNTTSALFILEADM